MLTAAHVVGSLSLAHPLDQREVLLGAAFARPSSGDPRIGDVIASHPAEPSEEVQIDASLVRVDEHVTLTQLVRDTITSELGDEPNRGLRRCSRRIFPENAGSSVSGRLC